MFILPDNPLNIKGEAYKSLFKKIMITVQHVDYFQPARFIRVPIGVRMCRLTHDKHIFIIFIDIIKIILAYMYPKTLLNINISLYNALLI